MFYKEIVMGLFLLLGLYPFLSDAQKVKHYLHYRFTVLTKANTLPEFSAVVVSDDRQIKHYSNEERVWILTEDDWTEAPEEAPDSRDWFIHQIRTLSNCANSECSELHVLQRITGCELKKSLNGTITNLTAFDKYGFDGEDFIAFNSDTMQWIDKNPKAKETKMKWDQQTKHNKFLQHSLKTCMNWISTVNNTKKTLPDVHVFALEVPDDHSELNLSCLATGFYPRDIEINIRLDETILKDQISSGIRPNDDGSFQMRSSVKIDRSHKGSYDCLVIHISLTKPVSTNWDGACFDSETIWPVIVGVAVAVVAGLVSTCWLCFKYPEVIGTAFIASWNPSLYIDYVDERNDL